MHLLYIQVHLLPVTVISVASLGDSLAGGLVGMVLDGAFGRAGIPVCWLVGMSKPSENPMRRKGWQLLWLSSEKPPGPDTRTHLWGSSAQTMLEPLH